MLDDNDDNVPAWNDRDYTYEEVFVMIVQKTGCEIVPNTGTNAIEFFILATKSWKLIAKLANRMLHHNLI